jgi:hypothetical protein
MGEPMIRQIRGGRPLRQDLAGVRGAAAGEDRGRDGGRRTYEHVVGLRTVTSTDGMTADFYPFDMTFLGGHRHPHHQRGQGRQPRRL